MAVSKKKPYREYEQELNRQIKENKFKPVTVFCGEQWFLIRTNRKKLEDALLGTDDSLNLSVFKGEEAKASQIIEAAQTLPFFSDKRVIVVENSGLLNRAGEEGQRLSSFLDEMPDTSFLIFAESSVNASIKLYKAIAKKGFICQCDTPDDRWIASFSSSLFEEAGLSISREALSLFLTRAGKDLERLNSEAQKLIGYCLERGKVQKQDVETICIPALNDRVFDLIGAVSSGKRNEALDIYLDLKQLRTSPQVILSLMIRQYTQLLEAGELLQKMKAEEAASVMQVSPWVMKCRLRPVLRGYNKVQLENAVFFCARADSQYKSGKISADLAVEELIVILSQRKS